MVELLLKVFVVEDKTATVAIASYRSVSKNLAPFKTLLLPDPIVSISEVQAEGVQLQAQRNSLFCLPQPVLNTLSLYFGCASACTAHILYRVRLDTVSSVRCHMKFAMHSLEGLIITLIPCTTDMQCFVWWKVEISRCQSFEKTLK